MNKLFAIMVTSAFSAPAFSSDIPSNVDYQESGSNYSLSIEDKSVLQNRELKNLHKDMVLNGLSEVGMEARRQMMTAEGRAYHKALEHREKDVAG
ncbi:hypothetical protein [Marinobacter sp.]|uniref:hypothetical protein n=1 Tax=Marinobacter sp. TaxID=50741 RepID=UPI0035C6C93E|nr:hypothetical protein [Oleiphilaceae bacterium]